MSSVWLSNDVMLACVPREVGVETIAGAWTRLVYRSESGALHTLLLVRGAREAETHVPERTDLQTLCRESLAVLEVDERDKIIEFLASGLTAQTGHGRLELSQSLLVARDALRERLPYATPDNHPTLHVDAVIAADPHHVLVTGWMTAGEGDGGSLVAVSPEGVRVDLSERACRHRHRLFEESRGFTASRDLGVPAYLPAGWRVELRRADGSGVEVKARPAITNLASARRAALDVLGSAEQRDALLRQHLFPALDRMQQARRSQTGPADVVEFGAPVDSPAVSIVVAVGEREDLVEHQLAQFSGDPDFAIAELIYVVDSPASRDRFVERAGHLSQLYRVPIRAALLSEYAGAAASIGSGVAHARGELLVLLSPETLPDARGWISQLRALSRAPGIGAVVPRTRAVQEANPRNEPTMLSAAVAIRRALFDELNGLAGRYIGVDFEMADVCQRASLTGAAVTHARDVLLVDVRGEPRMGSMPKVERIYDEWVFNLIWGDDAGRSVERLSVK